MQYIFEGLISDRTVKNCFVKFRSGDTTLKDELSAGHPSDFNDNLLKAILEQNPCHLTRDIVESISNQGQLFTAT